MVPMTLLTNGSSREQTPTSNPSLGHEPGLGTGSGGELDAEALGGALGAIDMESEGSSACIQLKGCGEVGDCPAVNF